jgi:methyl-accepting chemotaxis protein
MSWFRNQKMAMKLTIGFGTAIVGLLIIIVLALKGLSFLDDETQLLAHDRFPKTVWTNNVVDNINLIARAVRNVLLQEDPVEQTKEKDRIAKAKLIIEANLDSLKRTVNSKKGLELMNLISEPRERYIYSRNQMFDSLTAGNRTAALKLLFGDVRKSQADYFKAVEDVIAFQNQLVKEAGIQAKNTFDSVKA